MSTTIENADRTLTASASPTPAKNRCGGGVRLLSVVLQAVVMAAALALFFIFAGFAALVLLHLLVASRALRRCRISSSTLSSSSSPSVSASPSLEPPPVTGLSPRDIRRIPCFKYKLKESQMSLSKSSGPAPWDCAVCLDGFREGNRLRAIPGCGHAFHASCVDKWLVRSSACPICRRMVSQT